MSLDLYKVPRDQVDVEALAQELARYVRITTEDTEFLSYDPAHPDEYLGPANAAIAELTPPKSLEDRAKRMHIAFGATMVFSQFKIAYALRDHPDLDLEVERRQAALMDDWFKNEYPRLFPDRAKAMKDRASWTPPNASNTVQASLAAGRSAQPKVISIDDVSQYLNKPETLLGKRFLHSPPQDQEQDYKGTWEMDSYSVRMSEGRIDHEYQILLEALDGAPLPMGREDARFLLTHSTQVA
ncbi:hypothetical protein C8Q76DRAFT_764197 [Earliella scabrosa]|nr:hypothetical protein C8Q76DRAFT_764197 [Earliella scabrosa]